MFETVLVHDRVSVRHPKLRVADVVSAWRNAFAVIQRGWDDHGGFVLVAVGTDSNGRLIEMVASRQPDGSVLVYHAMTPPSAKTLREVGLAR